jgi:transglutaminase-like putative cysteine protease
MKKNIGCITIAFFLVVILFFSGCEMISPPTTYEASPTEISYDISYGYQVNCTGTGNYEITYLCDTPDVVLGTATYDLLYPNEYQIQTLVNNTLIKWNISGSDEQTYNLGVAVHVQTQSILVADLNGEAAESIQGLQNNYPIIVNHYVKVQTNQTIRYIDPEDPNIIAIVDSVVSQVQTNNSFLVAEALFSWLKEHVTYQTHPDESGVRSAVVTLSKKTGDCDDLSFLYISLCRAAGIPARFIRGYLINAYDNGSADAVAHAWVEVFVGGGLGNNGWIPVETACITDEVETDIQQNFGLESAFHLRLFIDDGSNESLGISLTSISYLRYGTNREIQIQSFVEVSNYQQLEAKKLVVTKDNNRYYE